MFQVEFFKNATYLCQMFFAFENRVKINVVWVLLLFGVFFN